MGESVNLIAGLLAREARLLARVGTPEDAVAARRLADALRDPSAVARLLGESFEPVPEVDHRCTCAARASA